MNLIISFYTSILPFINMCSYIFYKIHINTDGIYYYLYKNNIMACLLTKHNHYVAKYAFEDTFANISHLFFTKFSVTKKSVNKQISPKYSSRFCEQYLGDIIIFTRYLAKLWDCYISQVYFILHLSIVTLLVSETILNHFV